jgi:hypothetical protein
LDQSLKIDALMKNASAKSRAEAAKKVHESKIKEEAITKVVEMRNRQNLLNTEDETLTLNYWQQKWEDS